MGFINKLIGGFFSFLGSIFKIFNIFKKSEYYLEAPDSPAATTPAPAAKAQAPTPAAAPAKAAASNGKVEKPVATVAAAEPVKVVSAPVAAPAAPAAPVTLFAPNFLGTASSAGRRRPGPSLSPYMDMAKKVKS